MNKKWINAIARTTKSSTTKCKETFGAHGIQKASDLYAEIICGKYELIMSNMHEVSIEPLNGKTDQSREIWKPMLSEQCCSKTLVSPRLILETWISNAKNFQCPVKFV